MTDKTATPASQDAGKDVTAAAAALELASQTAANARSEGEKTGAQAAQARIKAILTAPDATGRSELANHLAFNTAMSVEGAIATLKATPAQAAAKQGSRLDTLMGEHAPKVDAVDSGKDGHVAALAGAVTRQLAQLGKKPLALN